MSTKESIHRTADFTVEQAAYWNWALQHKGRIDDQPEVIEKVTVNFHDESYEVDIKLCNSDDPDTTPYIDCVLFIDGCENDTCEPSYETIHDAEFFFADAMGDDRAFEISVHVTDLADTIAEIEATVAQPETDDFTWLRDTILPKLEQLAWAQGQTPTSKQKPSRSR